MLIYTKWNIITGTSCSGKTKVIERLSYLGYKTYPEVSRILIDNEISKGKTIEEIKSIQYNFEKMILELKINLEERIHPENIIFFDRSLLDSEAFITLYKVKGIDISKYNKYRYNKIFFLESLKLENDKHRFENENQRNELELLLLDTYKKYNYNITYIPIKPIENRVFQIIEEIKENHEYQCRT